MREESIKHLDERNPAMQQKSKIALKAVKANGAEFLIWRGVQLKTEMLETSNPVVIAMQGTRSA